MPSRFLLKGLSSRQRWRDSDAGTRLSPDRLEQLRHRRHDFRGIGKVPFRPFGYDLVADLDLEDAAGPGLERRLDAQLLPKFSSSSLGPRLVPAGLAVGDDNLSHVVLSFSRYIEMQSRWLTGDHPADRPGHSPGRRPPTNVSRAAPISSGESS